MRAKLDARAIKCHQPEAADTLNCMNWNSKLLRERNRGVRNASDSASSTMKRMKSLAPIFLALLVFGILLQIVSIECASNVTRLYYLTCVLGGDWRKRLESYW
jgi:hypothetical protein